MISFCLLDLFPLLLNFFLLFPLVDSIAQQTLRRVNMLCVNIVESVFFRLLVLDFDAKRLRQPSLWWRFHCLCFLSLSFAAYGFLLRSKPCNYLFVYRFWMKSVCVVWECVFRTFIGFAGFGFLTVLRRLRFLRFWRSLMSCGSCCSVDL